MTGLGHRTQFKRLKKGLYDHRLNQPYMLFNLASAEAIRVNQLGICIV
jgi:hypothetical protein